MKLMRIKYCSIPIIDQAKALAFYTEVLGFVKKTDVPFGDASWLTVVSTEDPDGVELSLEPATDPDTTAYKAALVSRGIPWTAFQVDNVQAEYERLVALGVKFTVTPTNDGIAEYAVFDDTCGNLIQISNP